MHVDHHLKPDHAQVEASVFGQAYLQQLVELLIDIFELSLEHGLGEDILLPDHLCGLF